MTDTHEEKFEAAVQRLIKEHIDVPTMHNCKHYLSIVTQEIENYKNELEQWEYAIQLRTSLSNFQKQNSDTVTTAVSNSYAMLVALQTAIDDVQPYLCTNKPEAADNITAIEQALLQGRIEEAKAYLKKEKVNATQVYEDLNDIITYSGYGRLRFAQLLLGMMATLVAAGHITQQQGDVVCSTIIVGLDDASPYLSYLSRFSNN